MPLKITRRRSAIHGNGVFATEAIKKGEPVVQYKGKLITHAEADAQRHADVDTGHTFLFTLNEHWIIDANEGGNVARWINQSCEPNCIPYVHEHPSGDPRKDKVIIEALRAIKPGEEITYDYGLVFDEVYTKKLLQTWACRCGSPKCRGTMLKPKEEAMAELLRA
ncbi:MAG: SET domain-containing protein-lysine N-methyltransferase [Flavobacteriales bacterium]